MAESMQGLEKNTPMRGTVQCKHWRESNRHGMGTEEQK